MKKKSILTVMIAFVAMCTFAQTPASPQTPTAQPAPGAQQARPMRTPEEMAKNQTDRMKTQLDLTPAQYEKILTINKDFFTQTEALRTPGQPMSEESRTKMRDLSKAKEDKVNAILTAEQIAKRKTAPPRPNGPGNTMPGAPAPATPAPGK